jgi:hypothetical protein
MSVTSAVLLTIKITQTIFDVTVNEHVQNNVSCYIQDPLYQYALQIDRSATSVSCITHFLESPSQRNTKGSNNLWEYPGFIKQITIAIKRGHYD